MSETTTPTYVTPYQAARVMNAILQDEGLPAIRPQMIYNYVRKGTIASTDGKINITDQGEKGFSTWARKYIEKKRNQDTQSSVEDLRSLMGM